LGAAGIDAGMRKWPHMVRSSWGMQVVNVLERVVDDLAAFGSRS